MYSPTCHTSDFPSSRPYQQSLDPPFHPTPYHPLHTRLILPQLHAPILLQKRIRLHQHLPRPLLRKHNHPPLFEHALHLRQVFKIPSASRHIGRTPVDVQTEEEGTEGGFAVGEELGAVDLDREGAGKGRVADC